MLFCGQSLMDRWCLCIGLDGPSSEGRRSLSYRWTELFGRSVQREGVGPLSRLEGIYGAHVT